MSAATNSGSGLRALLVLQQRDTEVSRLEYRRAHLPAHGQLAAIQGEAGVLRPELLAAQQRRAAAAAVVDALEGEVGAVTARVAEIDSRLYGSVQISPKDAQAMVEEVAHLRERRSGLEDRELEAMELLEPEQAEALRLEGEAQALSDRLRAAQSALADQQAEVEAEIAPLREARAEAAATVPTVFLEEYDRLRSRLDGVAVASLDGNRCSGCHLTLSATALDRLRKANDDDVVHCEECGRILVR